MADSSQRLDRVSALVQTGFCGWQESVLATAAQINLGGLLAQSAIVVLPERSGGLTQDTDVSSQQHQRGEFGAATRPLRRAAKTSLADRAADEDSRTA